MSEMQDTTGKKIVFGSRKRTDENAFDKFAILEAPFPSSDSSFYWVRQDAEADENSNADVTPIPAIVITQEVLSAVNHHVSESLDHEMGGFLLGNRYRCPESGSEYIIIDQYSKAQFTEATSVSLSFTYEAWQQLNEELSGKFYGKLVLGWYHSHPKLEVFLSSYDVDLHKQRFPDPWMPALVIEPEKQLGGFFIWRNGKINPRVPVGFYEYIQSADSKESIMPWANYVCKNPVTGEEISPNRSIRPGIAHLIQPANGAARTITRNTQPSAEPGKFWPISNLKGPRLAAVVGVASLILLILAAMGTILRNSGGEKAEANPFKSFRVIGDVIYQVNKAKDTLEVTMKLENAPENLVVRLNEQEADLARLSRNGNMQEIRASVSSKEEIEKLLKAPSDNILDLSDGSNQGPLVSFHTEPKDIALDTPLTAQDVSVRPREGRRTIVAAAQPKPSSKKNGTETVEALLPPKVSHSNQTSTPNGQNGQHAPVQQPTQESAKNQQGATRQSTGWQSLRQPAGGGTGQQNLGRGQAATGGPGGSASVSTGGAAAGGATANDQTKSQTKEAGTKHLTQGQTVNGSQQQQEASAKKKQADAASKTEQPKKKGFFGNLKGVFTRDKKKDKKP